MESPKKFKEGPNSNGDKKSNMEALLSSEPPKKKPCLKMERGERCGSKAEEVEEQDPKPGPSREHPADSGDTMTAKRYTGKVVIGKGGFGQVVKVWDVIKKRHIAIKTVPRGKSSSAEMCLRMEKEVLEIAVGSPFLIHSHLSFGTQKRWYFSMEFAAGGDLLAHIKNRGRLPIQSATFYTAEIISGIQFLHKKGYIHRDIKTSNILIASSGHIKLADFGLALKKTEGIRGNAGTRGYKAPEVISGKPYNISADYYSLGVVVFQLATGRPVSQCILSEFPFYGLNTHTENIIKELLEEDPGRRLGVNGCIRSHLFFNDIDWEDLEELRIAPPYIPVTPDTRI